MGSTSKKKKKDIIPAVQLNENQEIQRLLYNVIGDIDPIVKYEIWFALAPGITLSDIKSLQVMVIIKVFSSFFCHPPIIISII